MFFLKTDLTIFKSALHYHEESEMLLFKEKTVEQKTESSFWTTPPKIVSFAVRDYENIWRQEAHLSSCNELLYVLDGKFTLEFDRSRGTDIPAVAGDFLLVPRRVMHKDVFEPLRGLRILMIMFHWPNAQEYFSTVTSVELHRLDFLTRSEARRRLDFLYDLWCKKQISMENLNVQLHALLLLFYCAVIHSDKTEIPEAEKLGHPKLIQQTKFFLSQNYASDISLEQTAQHFGISPSYLSRLFQREFGVSFSSYLTSLRLENALSLLNHTSLQLAEIAYRCGFKDSSYFIKVFRQHYGTTPGNYRS